MSSKGGAAGAGSGDGCGRGTRYRAYHFKWQDARPTRGYRKRPVDTNHDGDAHSSRRVTRACALPSVTWISASRSRPPAASKVIVRFMQALRQVIAYELVSKQIRCATDQCLGTVVGLVSECRVRSVVTRVLTKQLAHVKSFTACATGISALLIWATLTVLRGWGMKSPTPRNSARQGSPRAETAGRWFWDISTSAVEDVGNSLISRASPNFSAPAESNVQFNR